MADISKINLSGAVYNIKDATARANLNEIQNISDAEIDEITDFVLESLPSSYVYGYETAAAMQADLDLQKGMIAHTNGFTTSGDGNAAYYTISNSGTTDGSTILALQNGLRAIKISESSSVTSAKIVDRAITTSKIADNAITADKIESSAVDGLRTMSTTQFGVAKVGAGLAMNGDALELDGNGDIATAVTSWLNAHPEATTTVEDGSITTIKLADGVLLSIDQQATFVHECVENGENIYSPSYTNYGMNTITGEQSSANARRASTPDLYYLPVECELHASFESGYAAQLFCYDATKTYLGYRSVTSIVDGAYPLYDGTCYFRLQVYKTADADISNEEARQNATFTAVYKGVVSQLNETTLRTSDIVPFVPDDMNHFDVSTLQVGYEVYANGEIRIQADSAASDYIDVYGKSTVYFYNLPVYSAAGIGNQRYACFYDDDMTLVETRKIISSQVSEASLDVPSGAYFMAFSPYQRWESGSKDCSSIMVTFVPTDGQFEPYKPYLKSLDGMEVAAEREKPLDGVRVMFFGDSITAIDTRYRKWLLQETGMVQVESFAVSGATLTNKDDTEMDGNPSYSSNNTVPNQVQKLLNGTYDTPDIAIISASTNDAYNKFTGLDESEFSAPDSQDPLLAVYKDVDTCDLTTVSGAMRWIAEKILSVYPYAQIFFVTPIQRATRPSLYRYLKDKHDTITEIAQRMSCCVIDATYKSGIYSRFEVADGSGKYLADGLHPNERGGRLLAKCYADEIACQIHLQ